MRRTAILFTIMFLGIAGYAQKHSDKLKPQWMTDTPVSKIDGIFYIPVSVYSTDYNSIFTLSLNELTKHLPREWNVKTNTEVTRDSHTERSSNSITRNQRTQHYRLNVEANGEPVEIRCRVVDSYWEKEKIGGNKQYKGTVLYQVSAPDVMLEEETALTTTKYGLSGFWRSAILPGWGQWHKGSKVKGFAFLASEAAAVAGIIVSENMRASYIKKAKEQPKFVKEYSNKADNWENGRNVCIGVAAGIWLYNIIDALVSPGAKRVVLNRSSNGVYISPTTGTNESGISIGYNF
ncbi:MAG: hypothetical protein IKJ95_02985 [Bacteroidaceae bacterium]|nr:hypothetical protein [Bacteroidaceae bacterium]